MKTSFFIVITLLLFLHGSKVCGLTPNKCLKLADNLRIMMRHPKYEYLPKLRKSLNMYAGILSYMTLKLEQEPGDSEVEDFYLFGPPRFMTMPIKEKRRTDLKKNYKWTDRDLTLFLEELNDAKKVWREFARTLRMKKPDISEEPELNKSLVID